jgi:predicted lipid-binding transport protein (Tim44 family)
MKNWLIGALVVALSTTVVPTDADAKRLGGGKNSGMQRNMPERTAPDTPAKPAAPAQPPGTPAQQAAPAAPATAGAAAAAAAPAKRSWMGPIAGLAAGLGLAALMSHLGLGEAFANFLMLALLAVAVVFLVAFLMRRFGKRGAPATPALAGAGAGSPMGGAQVAWPQAGTERRALDEATPAAPSGATGFAQSAAAEPAVVPATAAAPVAKAFVPAAFDSEGFERTAKMIFIRLQAANDAADLDDLRRFTTPELFASLRLDLQERGPSAQHTDVTRVDAQVLDVTNEAERQVVSVRFQGELVEAAGAAPTAVDEVWHLVKPHGDAGSWAIAGIEQMS